MRQFTARGPILIPTASAGTEAISFDGTTGFLSKVTSPSQPVFSGELDTRQWVSSFWFKLRASTGADQYFFSSSTSGPSRNEAVWWENSTGKIRMIGRIFSGTDSVQIDSSNTISIDNTWHHLAISVEGNNPTLQMYIDGVDRSAVNLGTPPIDLGWGHTEGFILGGNFSNFTPTLTTPCAADIAWFWLDNNTTLDLSSNITKFRTGGGAPASLGSNGQTPTGSSPMIYLHGLVGSWTTNLGTGGNLTSTGGVTQAASDPP